MRTAFTIAAAMLCVPQDAGPTAPRAKEIDAWVAQLGEADLSKREAARARLLGLVADLSYAHDALRKARESKDVSVALLASQLQFALDDALYRRLHPLPDATEEDVYARVEKDGFKKVLGDVRAMEEDLSKGDPTRERVYQAFLVHYKGLRATFPGGDPLYLNQLDDCKKRVEEIYRGAARLLREAHVTLAEVERLEQAGDIQGVEGRLRMLRQMRSRREFFQDERVLEMERVIEGAERKLATMRKR